MEHRNKPPNASLPTSIFFGLPDAARENQEKLFLDHVPNDIEPLMKVGKKAEGYEVIVGNKGSGKTALRRFIELDNKKSITWVIDVDHNLINLDPEVLKGRSGILKNIIALEILREFAVNLHETQLRGMLGKPSSDKLEKLSERIIDALKNIRDAVDVQAGPVKINLAELLKARSSVAVTKTLKFTIDGLKDALDGHRAYIMIDDVDDIFPSIENNPIFVEGLARAVDDINFAFGAQIHALLFLKYGVWRRWFENQQELDRVSHKITDLRWDHTGLCLVIARRIARLHKIKLNSNEDIDIPKLWALEFELRKDHDFEHFSREFTELCVCGPRDIIHLANKAKENAGNNKIQLKDLYSQLEKYSEQKLGEIHADFGEVYPEINTFIDSVFHGCPSEMTGLEAANWIDKHALLCKRVDDLFRKQSWYGSKERLTSLMYEVGLWGVKRRGGKVTYSIELPSISPSEIMDASVIIHPAFRPYLGTVAKKTQVQSKKMVVKRIAKR